MNGATLARTPRPSFGVQSTRSGFMGTAALVHDRHPITEQASARGTASFSDLAPWLPPRTEHAQLAGLRRVRHWLEAGADRHATMRA